jgi:putative DNA primase/helicase
VTCRHAKTAQFYDGSGSVRGLAYSWHWSSIRGYALLSDVDVNVHRNSRPANRTRPSAAERESVARSAVKNILRLLDELLPGGTRHGDEYIVPNPTRNDKRAGSFKVHVAGSKAGVWSDFATGDRGGDLISLVAYIKRCSVDTAARWILKCLNLSTDRKSSDDSAGRKSGQIPKAKEASASKAFDELKTSVPPDNAERLFPALARLGCRKPVQHWLYHNADGSKAFYILRFNKRDGSKNMLPLSWCRSPSDEGWRIKGWPRDCPLYDLPTIVGKPRASILVCEGEKAADAAESIYGHHDLLRRRQLGRKN